MSDKRKPEGGTPPSKREQPLRDLPKPSELDAVDGVRGGRGVGTPPDPSPIPTPYPNG